MFKYFTTSILLFFFIVSTSYAEVIKKIQVNGNQRITLETILVLGDIKVGSEYSDDKLNNTLKNLSFIFLILLIIGGSFFSTC